MSFPKPVIPARKHTCPACGGLGGSHKSLRCAVFVAQARRRRG